MMAEGMVEESLILTRMIHDRYHAAKRNPFNEIECSDHYARAMASYGTFITACGFEYHGPKGYMKFAPKIGAEYFKAPFTSAEGWCTYQQKFSKGKLKASVMLQYGKLRLNSFGFESKEVLRELQVTVNGIKTPCSIKQKDGSVIVKFEKEVTVKQGGRLEFNFLY
jgi:hypothetical protein